MTVCSLVFCTRYLLTTTPYREPHEESRKDFLYPVLSPAVTRFLKPLRSCAVALHVSNFRLLVVRVVVYAHTTCCHRHANVIPESLFVEFFGNRLQQILNRFVAFPELRNL